MKPTPTQIDAAIAKTQAAVVGEPVAYASSKEWRKNHLMSAAQYKNALPKNVVDFDIPLYATLPDEALEQSEQATFDIAARLLKERDALASRISQQDAELERLRREVEEARAKLFPYADATEISGISFDGKYLIGDKKSISYFHEMKNRGEQIDVYARAYEQRIAAAEAKITEEQEARAILEGHLSAAIDDYNEARKAAFIEAAEMIEDMVDDDCFPLSDRNRIAAPLRAKAEETRT